MRISFTLLVSLCLLSILHAQGPVTTAAAIQYGEKMVIYYSEEGDTLEMTVGPDFTFDLRDFSDMQVEYWDGTDYAIAPASEVPKEGLYSLELYEIDQAYRDTFGLPLPAAAVGVNYDYPDEEETIAERTVLSLTPSGLYDYAYEDIEFYDGEISKDAYAADHGHLFVPLGLSYGEAYDTTVTTKSTDPADSLDTYFNETFTSEYLGYGKVINWQGEETPVSQILVTTSIDYYGFDYDEDTLSVTSTGMYTELFLMSESSVIPMVVLYGEYNAADRSFRYDYPTFLLPADEGSVGLSAAGIPDATIEVFPNPTHGAFRVDLTLDRATTLDVELYSAAGQRLHRRTGLTAAPGTTRIPVSGGDLTAGLYLVKLTLADGRSETRRVVVN